MKRNLLCILVPGVLLCALILVFTITGDNSAGITHIGTSPQESNDSSSESAPLSTPLTSPVSSPLSDASTESINHTTTSDDSTNPEIIRDVTYLTFTHDDLPGFSVDYPANWDIAIKEFDVTESRGFKSNYYAYYDSYITDCTTACMGLRLSNSDVSVELVFDIVVDDGGTICSNTAELEQLNNSWYRIKYNKGYFYSQNIKRSVIAPEPELRYAIEGETRAIKGQTYVFCDYLSGNNLIQDPPAHLAEAGAILLEKPRVTDTPDDATLAIMDEMITSIKGVEAAPNWIRD